MALVSTTEASRLPGIRRHRDFNLCRAFTDALLVQVKDTMALLQQDPCARVRLRGGVSPLVHLVRCLGRLAAVQG